MARTHKFLWVIQWLLAALFLFAGASKFAIPAAELAKQTPLPIGFIRFIGVCEVLGAIGLVAPGLTHVRTSLTPLAALGLTIIMIGAVFTSAIIGPVAGAIFPFAVGALAAFVAYGRNRLVPLPR